jgi:hypothetical protein
MSLQLSRMYGNANTYPHQAQEIIDKCIYCYCGTYGALGTSEDVMVDISTAQSVRT